MPARPKYVGATSSKAAVAALAVALLTVSVAGACGAEIPHENYDLVGSDLEMVIALLNASIRASEDALLHMVDEDLSSADTSLELIGTALGPASALLDQMMDVADSYEDLSVLLPPFTYLHDDMTDFVDMEEDLLRARDLILALSGLDNMTDEETNEALNAVSTFSSLIVVMRGTTDSMLESARAIDNLTVDDIEPFVPNALEEMIGDLREFLDTLERQLEDAVQDDVPWQEDISFLLIWLSRDEVYLGEDLIGGGYLYSDSSFIEGVAVTIAIDSIPAVDLTTGTGGRFGFVSAIPVEEAWLGQHSIQGTVSLPGGDILSEVLHFTVRLVPTVMTLHVASRDLSPGDTLQATMRLKDVRGPPMAGTGIVLTVDGADIVLTTGEDGSARWSRAADILGLGTHALSARYEGALPYAQSASGTVTVSVTIPTSLNLTLFADKVQVGGYLLGTCGLVSNGTEPLQGRTVMMAIDGIPVRNYTTGADGSFAFSHRTDGVWAGGHVLNVTFEADAAYWSDAYAEVPFTIVLVEEKEYPFFPWIPGWGGGLASEIPDLFFGDNAYYTWLLMLLVLGLAVKAMSVRRAKRASRGAEEERRRTHEETHARPGLQASSGSPASWSLDRHAAEPSTPHDSIIWHYGRLMSFLRRQRRVGLAESMTHWEIARLLLRIGYPRGPTQRVTTLFERAFYSGSGVTSEDAGDMKDSVKEMVDHSGGAGRAG